MQPDQFNWGTAAANQARPPRFVTSSSTTASYCSPCTNTRTLSLLLLDAKSSVKPSPCPSRALCTEHYPYRAWYMY